MINFIPNGLKQSAEVNTAQGSNNIIILFSVRIYKTKYCQVTGTVTGDWDWGLRWELEMGNGN